MTLRETGPAVAQWVHGSCVLHMDDVRRTILKMEGQRHHRARGRCCSIDLHHGMLSNDGARSFGCSIWVGRKIRRRRAAVDSHDDAERVETACRSHATVLNTFSIHTNGASSSGVVGGEDGSMMDRVLCETGLAHCCSVARSLCCIYIYSIVRRASACVRVRRWRVRAVRAACLPRYPERDHRCRAPRSSLSGGAGYVLVSVTCAYYTMDHMYL
jgi:hypothetical protein